MIGVLGITALTFQQYHCDIPIQEEVNLTIQYALEKARTRTAETIGSYITR